MKAEEHIPDVLGIAGLFVIAASLYAVTPVASGIWVGSVLLFAAVRLARLRSHK